MRLLVCTDPKDSQHEETLLRSTAVTKGFVLLLEDSDDDAFFLKRAWKTRGMNEEILWMENGFQAKQYLSGESDGANIPALIITDLKMPHCDGFAFLRWLRAQPKVRAIKCVVLSSSSEVKDLSEAKAAGADGFFTKPSNSKTYGNMLNDIAVHLTSVGSMSDTSKVRHSDKSNEWMSTTAVASPAILSY